MYYCPKGLFKGFLCRGASKFMMFVCVSVCLSSSVTPIDLIGLNRSLICIPEPCFHVFALVYMLKLLKIACFEKIRRRFSKDTKILAKDTKILAKDAKIIQKVRIISLRTHKRDFGPPCFAGVF